MKLLTVSTTLLCMLLATAKLALPGRDIQSTDKFVAEAFENSASPDQQQTLGGLVPPIDLAAYAETEGTSGGSRAFSQPHGHRTCATGCAVSNHPIRFLSADDCGQLLAEYQASPVDQAGAALESLLYFGAQTRWHLASAKHQRLLDAQHLRFLTRELSRERAIVSIRVVDEFQQIRAELPATNVPQHVRQVFTLDAENLQSIVCSGTVKRVGLNHIWQRL